MRILHSSYPAHPAACDPAHPVFPSKKREQDAQDRKRQDGQDKERKKIRGRVKNFLIRAFFRKRKERREGASRFLVVSTTALGDTLWATPALRALKERNPKSHVAVLTSAIGKEILEENPFVDEIFVLKKPFLFSLIKLYFSLRKKGFEEILLFHASQRAVFPFCALLAPLIGTAEMNKGLDTLFAKTLPKLPLHEIERRLNLVGAPALDASLEIFLSAEDEQRAVAFLKEKKIPDYLPIVGMHPGAKDHFKCWPEDHFVEVGRRLANHLGCQVIITGGAAEKPLADRIAGQIEGALSIAGELPLRPFAALLRKFSLFITNDTGPMHLAFAKKTPTVAIFSATDPRLCGPYVAKNCTILSKERTCIPCLKKKCREPFCLLQISPSQVYDAAVNLFYREKPHVFV